MLLLGELNAGPLRRDKAPTATLRCVRQVVVILHGILVATLPAWLIAQEGGGGGLMQLMPAFIGMALLFYFMFIRPQNRERRKQENMLKELKKNDRVVTVGGIFGVVTNIQPDSNEVTIRVDESTNTRLRVSRSSIREVLKDSSQEDKSSK